MRRPRFRILSLATPRLRRMPRLRLIVNWILGLRGTPGAIAGGVAIGIVVAFTPTIGFQMLLAVGIATLLGANRSVSILPTWITNPITIPPLYAFTYTVGSLFWPGPGLTNVARALREVARELRRLDMLALRAQLEVFFNLGVDVFVPMWIGGLLVGGLVAALSYPITFRLVIELRELRGRRRGRRRRRARAQPEDPPSMPKAPDEADRP